MKKVNKKGMVAAWSDSETSDNESHEQQVANICQMTKEVRAMKKLSMRAQMR